MERRIPTFVVVGGGAGGLELATRLGETLGKRGEARVVLVDRLPIHIWKPHLHEVAAGSLDIGQHRLEYVAQARWHHFEFQLGPLLGIEPVIDIISVPPATTMSAMSAMIVAAARLTAVMPEPQ